VRGRPIGSRLFGLGSDRVTLRVPADQAEALTEALVHLGPGKTGIVQQSRAGGAVEVTGGRAVLHQATLVAIDDAGERLSGLCTALLRGEASAADVRDQLEALRGLLDLL
jgi:hypothetical protein